MKQHDQSGSPGPCSADRPGKGLILRTAAVLLTTAALHLTSMAPGAYAAATATCTKGGFRLKVQSGSISGLCGWAVRAARGSFA